MKIKKTQDRKGKVPVCLWLPLSMRNLFKKMAEERGMSMSALIRTTLLKVEKEERSRNGV